MGKLALALLAVLMLCDCAVTFPTDYIDGGTDGGSFCGNGVLNEGEECDGTNLDDWRCQDLGYVGGELGCTVECVLDESECYTSDCGNGILEEGEACESQDLNGETCASLTGLQDGELQCHSCAFDTSLCHECGNNLCEVQAETTTECPSDCEWVVIDGGDNHSCGVRVTGEVHCWGSNEHGQLGTGDYVNYTTPVPVLGFTGAIDVTATWGQFSCALKSDGTVWCWGRNKEGQLGTGSASSEVLVPEQVVSISDATDIVGGEEHACALISNRSVWCWGRNDLGQLGLGHTVDSIFPDQVVLNGGGELLAVQLTAGYGHNCGLTLGSGVVRCWGANYYKQAEPTDMAEMVLKASIVQNVSGGVEVSAGSRNSCVVLSSGLVWCWGDNSKGQIGVGFTSDWELPSQVVNLTGAVSVQTGESFVCSLLQNKNMWCWGENKQGQLGNGTKDTSYVPVKVGFGMLQVEYLNGGSNHTFVQTNDGEYWGWGENDGGQIGDGTYDNHSVPTQIAD